MRLTCFLIAMSFLLSGCAFSVAPTDSEESTLTVDISAYPTQLSAEDSATAEVWATVLQGINPVKDGTIVRFATTAGEITAESQTQDGLAVAQLISPGDGRPRRVAVVAQALTIRDTFDVDLVLEDGGL
ncbi:MAG TPA: hypothetical protein DGN59_22790 [Candidatus Latescibacteria bacterium]|nr:hypothetical protein [Candidatus Latescibacterota bacterium]MEC8990294.1 hypothetical protein [Candidatus Latescibacterota bacterium]MEE3039883.1 hypothetical protein [Candidatus Latescibacterota bacterium]MEE3264076.1 hypothetical protein [Candidatus Latescibacterota bacterium]HCV26287.1 hypothetical protein [Candidatus Latescibacterota bacterium]